MKLKCCIGICLLFVIYSLVGCNKRNDYYEKNDIVMGTFVSIKVRSDTGEEAVNAAFQRLEEIEQIMSSKIEDSELSDLNKNAYDKEVVVSEELFYVIEKAIYYAELSNGAFDPTIGRLVDMWNIGSGDERVLSNDEVSELIGLKNYKNVVLNPDNNSIKFNDSNVKIELGAIAKGYAADILKKMLVEEYSVKSGIISLGGNIITIGSKLDEEKWSVGIQSPTNSQDMIDTLEIADRTVVTSGNYERFFEYDGKKYHHIIDPKDGFPADNGIISATIIADSSIEADALSTATFIMGIDKSLKLIEGMEGIEAIFVTEDDEIIKTWE